MAGVVGFPLLFDTQPRPIAVDIPIEIPDKNKARPVVIAAAPAAPSAVEAPVAKSATVVTPKAPEKMPKVADVPTKPAEPKVASAATKATDKAGDKATDKITDKATDKATEKSTEKAVEKPFVSASPPTAVSAAKATSPDVKPAAKPSDAGKAQALLDGGSSDKPATAENRFVVQVGAFADVALAREARAKLERAGLKTYTTIVETKEGQRTRVRVGPFADKNDADTAASKIKALDLPAAILVL